MDKETIFNQFKEQGLKITKACNALLKILEKNRLPLAEVELRAKLSALGIVVNKTTIYRQLTHLKKINLIREVDFGDGKKRFELNTDDCQRHHHHIICTNCKKVEEIYVNDDVKQIELEISRNKKFKVTSHSLEFFGLCKNCK
jgi:Fe2+ or Zn2+ uptake regulation protein